MFQTPQERVQEAPDYVGFLGRECPIHDDCTAVELQPVICHLHQHDIVDRDAPVLDVDIYPERIAERGVDLPGGEHRRPHGNPYVLDRYFRHIDAVELCEQWPLCERGANMRRPKLLALQLRSLGHHFIDVLERPMIVVVVEERAEDAVAHHVAEMRVHQLRTSVDHRVIDAEVPEGGRVRADRFGAPRELEHNLVEVRRLRRRNRLRIHPVAFGNARWRQRFILRRASAASDRAAPHGTAGSFPNTSLPPTRRCWSS